jgi:hypothetical protein
MFKVLHTISSGGYLSVNKLLDSGNRNIGYTPGMLFRSGKNDAISAQQAEIPEPVDGISFTSLTCVQRFNKSPLISNEYFQRTKEDMDTS